MDAEVDLLDPAVCIDMNLPTSLQLIDNTNIVRLPIAESGNDRHEWPQIHRAESVTAGIDLNKLVMDIATVAQSWCKRATDYAAIETLVCRLPPANLPIDGHDSFAPYSDPYPKAILIRSFIVEKINGWDETALTTTYMRNRRSAVISASRHSQRDRRDVLRTVRCEPSLLLAN